MLNEEIILKTLNQKAYLRDIQESIRKIEKYTNNLTWEKFLKDELLQDGVIRNI